MLKTLLDSWFVYNQQFSAFNGVALALLSKIALRFIYVLYHATNFIRLLVRLKSTISQFSTSALEQSAIEMK